MDRSAAALAGDRRDARHVFIVGGARSGSTLLYRLLQQHPSFAPSKLQLTEPAVFNHLLTRARRAPSRFGSMRGFAMGDEAHMAAFLEETARTRRLWDALPPLALLMKRTRSPRLWPLLGGSAVLRSYYAHAHEAREAKRLVAKTPTEAHHLWKLQAAFPFAQSLFIQRHPVDVYDSAVRRHARDGSTGWLAADVETFLGHYRRWDAAVQRAEQDPAIRLHVLRYEDLVARPEPTLRTLLDVLGEEWTPTVLDRVQPPEGAEVRLAEPPTDARADAAVTDAAVHQIEAALEGSMRRWGYEAWQR